MPRVLYQSGVGAGHYRIVVDKQKVTIEQGALPDAMGNERWLDIYGEIPRKVLEGFVLQIASE